MPKDKTFIAILLSALADALYAISTPVSKVMLQSIAPTMVVAAIYLAQGRVKAANINITQTLTVSLAMMVVVVVGIYLFSRQICYLFGSNDVLLSMLCWFPVGKRASRAA